MLRTNVYRTKRRTQSANATDPDGDTVSYSLASAPGGMTIGASTGQIAWSPSTSVLGTHGILVRVEDGRGGTTLQKYTLTVETVVARGAG